MRFLYRGATSIRCPMWAGHKLGVPNQHLGMCGIPRLCAVWHRLKPLLSITFCLESIYFVVLVLRHHCWILTPMKTGSQLGFLISFYRHSSFIIFALKLVCLCDCGNLYSLKACMVKTWHLFVTYQAWDGQFNAFALEVYSCKYGYDSNNKCLQLQNHIRSLINRKQEWFFFFNICVRACFFFFFS